MVLKLEPLFDESNHEKWREARESYKGKRVTDLWMDKFLETTEKILEQRQDDFS